MFDDIRGARERPVSAGIVVTLPNVRENDEVLRYCQEPRKGVVSCLRNKLSEVRTAYELHSTIEILSGHQ